MGVHGLWELLAPVGRRVSVETLAGKKLAIDASIWMVQFMKAMRDEKGEMIRNAHLLGFFRRICKLLYLKTKPVFVFDGATPILKRRTVIARRRQRENAQAKIRKTAEKLLLNQLKQMRLKELAKDLDNQRKMQKNNNKDKGKMVSSDNQSDTNFVGCNANVELTKEGDVKLKEKLEVPSIGKDGGHNEDEDEDEVIILPDIDGNIDPDVLAALPQSMQRQLLKQPAMHGNVDPAVLAALPPSLQLDLLGQMRERLMAENRQKYQKVKKAPEKFSELQIQSYLKTVAFRREIDEVQRAAAGRGVAGVQTSRIASEANREFIFSSSFTGDKHVSNGNQFVETSHDDNGESVNVNESNQQSAFETESCMEITFEDDGKTEYFDDDDIFARLAAGEPVTLPSPEEKSLRKQPSGSDSDFEWEEGVVEGKWDGVTPGMNAEHNLLNKESNITDDGEVEWEEEPSDAPKSSSGPVESGRMLSKGYWEEESDLQEAIRRSLTDVGVEKSNSFPSDVIESKNLGENLDEDFGSLHEKGDTGASSFPGDAVNWQNKSCENLDRPRKPCTVNEPSISETFNSPESPSPVHNSDKNMTILSKFSERSDGSHSEQSRHNETAEFVATLEKEVDFPTGKHLDVSKEVDGLSTISDSWFKDNSHSFDAARGDIPDTIQVDKKTGSEDEPSNLVSDNKSSIEAEILDQDKKIDFEAKPSQQSVDTVNLSIPTVQSSANKVISDLHIEQELSGDITYENCVNKAEQHTDMSTIKGNDNEEIKFSKASLDEELLILDQECINMVDEQRKLERNAESVSSEMFAECQELLQMFGLPYIIAPMEAEAQCAYMELTNLVDGVVTDDSDVFLFGARSIYKNIFDDRKYVETYFMQDIEKELGLTREKLMRMALLLGSDYTEGVSGIGIVNAIEVVNAFSEEDGLHKFREWIESPDPTILGKLNVQEGSSAWKRGPKSTEKDVNSTKTSTRGSESNNGASSLDQNSFQAGKNMQSTDCTNDIKQIFMDKHRNVSKNWHIPSSFPSEAVISAYSLPQVDKSTEPFTWGRPDLFVLRKLCWEKFGWGSQKSDELLLPVLREYEKRETQLRMEAFYTFNERFAKIRSKRIKKAVKGITGNQSSELIDEGMQQVSKSRRKRRASPVQSGDDKSGEPSNKKEDIASRCQSKSTDKSVPKTSRKRQNSGKDVSFEMRTPEPQLQTLRRRKTNKQSAGNGRGRGGGEGRRRKGSSGFQQFETSSSGGDSGNDNQEVDGEKLDQPREVRRSMRTRNPVNYTVKDLEDEGGLSHKESSGEDAMEKEAGEDVKEKIQCEAREPSLDNIYGDYLETGGGFCMDERGTDLPDANQDVDLETEPTNDYLKMGGGFCMEGDIDQPDTSQDVNPFSETGSANDYLKMGGGFCMEESETIGNPDAGNYEDPVQATESSNCFAFMDKADDNIDSAEPSVNAEGSLLDKLQNGGKTPDEANDALNLNHRNAANKDDSKESASLREASDVGTTFISGLSAMPSLKRKRRRR
ncbi:hypothetical protein GOBAR_DD23080 [Gossypium barbadense]|nr:hypothetical protein GOBAR_DD23080 [Gossypium barbadense]